VAIGGYYIGGYCLLIIIILMAIGGYWCLLMIIILMAISGYPINGY
jgi:hypothetical protein